MSIGRGRVGKTETADLLVRNKQVIDAISALCGSNFGPTINDSAPARKQSHAKVDELERRLTDAKKKLERLKAENLELRDEHRELQIKTRRQHQSLAELKEGLARSQDWREVRCEGYWPGWEV